MTLPSKGNNKNKKTFVLKDAFIALLIITLSIAGLCAWLSPYWDLAGLLQAAAARDQVAIEPFLDMPLLRAEATTHPTLASEIAQMDIMLVDQELVTRTVRKTSGNPDTELTLKTFFGFADSQMAGRSRLQLTFSALKTMHANWLSDRSVQIANPEIVVLGLRREGFHWKLTTVSDPRTGTSL